MYFLTRMGDLNRLGLKVIRDVFEHPEFKRIMSEEHYDLIILEGIGMGDSLLGLGAHFKAPIIFISSVEPLPQLNKVIGNPQPFSYVPHVILGFSTPMDFKHRVYNMFFTILNECVSYLFKKPHYAMYK